MKNPPRSVVPDADDLRHEVVNLRNWLTHLPPEGGAENEPEAEPTDFFKYYFLLRVLLELSFLADLRFSAGQIAQLAEGCKGYADTRRWLFEKDDP